MRCLFLFCIATILLSSCGKYGKLFKERKEMQKIENEKINTNKHFQQDNYNDFD